MADNPYHNHLTDDGETVEWKVLARTGKKVPAIKEFRRATGSGLYEAKTLVEDYIAMYERGAFSLYTDGVINVRVQRGVSLTLTTKNNLTTIVANVEVNANLIPAELPQAVADAILRFANFAPQG